MSHSWLLCDLCPALPISYHVPQSATVYNKWLSCLMYEEEVIVLRQEIWWWTGNRRMASPAEWTWRSDPLHRPSHHPLQPTSQIIKRHRDTNGSFCCNGFMLIVISIFIFQNYYFNFTNFNFIQVTRFKIILINMSSNNTNRKWPMIQQMPKMAQYAVFPLSPKSGCILTSWDVAHW